MPTFAELHRPGEPLLLPNAWDHASAAALAAAGFAAVGTTSLGVSAVLGVADAGPGSRDATLELASLLAPLPVHLTVDAGHGFSEDPEEVAAFAAALAERGAAGINLEDRCGPPEGFAAVVAAVKGRAPALFVNARTDTFWLGQGGVEDALERLRAYVAAGADGVFAPGVVEERHVAALAEGAGAPLNVLWSHPLPRLAELGVARVSTGSALFRIALGAALDAAEAARDGAPPPGGAPSYEEVEALAGQEP